jgi:adenine-specific DNA-methyltransferase
MTSLEFKGKAAVHDLHCRLPCRPLIPDPQISLSRPPALDDNLIIQGDNLYALKSLLPLFGGQVKCVYLDPPYNTGNAGWAYNDNMRGPQQQSWLATAVPESGLDRHERWLCMMLPRLYLLRDLLRADGMLFVSIDDHEMHRLRLLLDEVFGAEQFIATVIWEKVYSPRMDSSGFSVSHDYLLVYGRGPAALPNRLHFAQNLRQFRCVDPASGRYYRRRSLRKEGKDSLRQDVPSLYFALPAPDGTPVYPVKPDGTEGRWRWSRARYERELAAGSVEWLQRDGQWQAYARQYLDPQALHPPTTIWRHAEVGHNHEAQAELADLLGPRVFATPKPLRLLRRVLDIATSPAGDDLVLDAFAGTGTTAHAVLALNAADGGRRRFIVIEQEDYAADVTATRVRHAIAGLPGARDPQWRSGLDGSFSYFHVGSVD